MPSLMENLEQEERILKSPTGFVMHRANKKDEVVLVPIADTQMRLYGNGQRKHTTNPRRNGMCNALTTPENHAHIPSDEILLWQQDHGTTGYEQFNRDSSNKAMYRDPPNVYTDGGLCDGADTESFLSEQTEIDQFPLAFTQTANALNNLRLSGPAQSPIRRANNGAKSAESAYDHEVPMMEGDGLNLSYEQACEVEIRQYNMLLQLMHNEKVKWEEGIENLLQNRREIENRLRMFRQYRAQGYLRSPYRASHIQRGSHPIVQPNYEPRRFSSSSRFLDRLGASGPSWDNVNLSKLNRQAPLGFPPYASSSMDSIDDLSRNNVWIPDDTERPNGPTHFIPNPRFSYNSYGDHMASEFEAPPRSAERDEEAYLRQLATVSPVRSPDNLNTNPRRILKSMNPSPLKRFRETTILPHPFKLEGTSTNLLDIQTHGIADQSKSSTVEQQLSRVSRADVRRRAQGSERQRPYSHGRVPFESSELGVRRRQGVSELQQLRSRQMENCIPPEEMQQINLSSEPRLSNEGKQQLSQQHNHQPLPASTKSQWTHDSENSERNSISDSTRRIPRSEAPVDELDQNQYENGTQEIAQKSPDMQQAKSVAKGRNSFMFDPLIEQSEDDVDSMRTVTPTNARLNGQPGSRSEASSIHAESSSDKQGKGSIQMDLLSQDDSEIIHGWGAGSDQTLNSKTLTRQNRRKQVIIQPSDQDSSSDTDQQLEKLRKPGSVSLCNSEEMLDAVANLDPCNATNQDVVLIEVKPPLYSPEACFASTRAVRLICLGPLDAVKVEFHCNTQRSADNLSNVPEITSPSWFGVCYGDCDVLVYDLKSRALVAQCEDHVLHSRSPVIALLPFVSQASSSKLNRFSNSNLAQCSQLSCGLLCVLQEDGNSTLYNLANQRISGRCCINNQITFATLLPQPRVIQNCLTQFVLAITSTGNVICFQWNLTGYLREEKDQRHPQWEAEKHDLQTNIFDRLSEDGSEKPYVCCVSPHQPSNANSRANSCSPRNTSTSKKELSVEQFSLITASLVNSNQKGTTIVRLCRWVSNMSQLKLAQDVDKDLHCDSGSELVGISYAEIGGAPSICLCMTGDVFWFSFTSTDLVSSVKLPLCTQPTTLIPSVWPYKFLGSSLKSKPNERLWAAVGGRHILELSAFESQRRRDSHGRTSMTLIYVTPADSAITALASITHEEDLVIAGTDKGYVYLIPLSNQCYTCQIPNCMLGFQSKSDLVFHLVRDHYYADCPLTSGTSAICTWPDCDYVIKESNERINHIHVEKHAIKHASDQ